MRLLPSHLGAAVRSIALASTVAMLACEDSPHTRRTGIAPPPAPDNQVGVLVGTPRVPHLRPGRLQPQAGLVAPLDDHRDGPPEDTDPFPDHYREPGKVFGRSYGIDPLKTEYIDSYSGRLRLKYTDLQLPGRGLPIRIVRTYHNPTNPEGIVGLPILEGRNITGAGWDMHFGRVHSVDPIGGAFCRTGRPRADRNPILELPDGTRKILFDADAGAPYPLTSKDRWVASCVPGQHVVGQDVYNDGGLLVISPDGTRYTFDWLSHVRTGDTHHVWSVTRIEDRNGNWLQFSYRDRSTHVFTILDKIESSDGRKVFFKYDDAPSGGAMSATPLLTRIYNEDSSRSWRYFYVATNAVSQYYLTRVQGPAGLSWNYTYHQPGDAGPGGYSVKEVVNPYGGKTTYEYQTVNLKPLATTIPIQAVKRKSTSGTAVTAGQWDYNFLPHDPQGSKMDFTEVVGPTTRVLYEHCSLRALVQDQECAGQQGQVLVKETFERLPSGDYTLAQPLQRETFIWGFLKIGAQFEPINGTGIQQSIDATYHHVLARKTTYRDGEYYSTALYDEDDYGNVRFKMEYRATTPPPPYCWTQDDYDCTPAGSGCDLCTVSGGTKRRDTEYTYHTDPIRWIVNLKKNELLYDRCVWLTQEPSKPAFCDAQNSFLSGRVRQFDALGNLREEHSHNHTDKTLYTYYATGELKTKTDPKGNVYSYSDYYRGIPRREDHPEGVTIRRTIDDNGNVTSQTDGRQNTSTFGYDGLGRVTSIETPRPGDANITVNWDWNDLSAGGKATRTLTRGIHEDKRSYDAFGREVGRTVGGITRTFDYDGEGRRTFASYPGSSEGTILRYDPLGRLIEREHSVDTKKVRYAYLDENVVEVTNERDKKTRYHYRAFGNPDKKELIKIVSPDTLETTIKRHQSGAIYSIVQGDCDVHCRTRFRARDDRYRIRIQTHPESGAHKYTHDENGNLVTSMVDGKLGKPDGEISGVTQRHYDGLNRLRRVDYPGNTLPTILTYNKVNKTETVTRGDIKWHYQYDENNNITHETLTAERRTFQLAYGYDAQDVVSSMTFPSGLVVSYAPDALGRPTKAAPYVTSLSHHPTGEIQQMVYQNGRTTTIGLDPRQRLATIAAPGVVDLSYSYDDVGNVTGVVDALDNNNTRAMTYDDRDRLSTVSGIWGAGSVSYNAYGDITNKTIGGTTQTYQYGADNKATKLSYVSGDSFIAYFYDVYGNVKGRGAALFAYDDSGAVTSFRQDANSPATLYAYDGKGHRTVETASDGKKRISLYNSAGYLVYEDKGCAELRTDHIRLGRTLVASRSQGCSGDTDGDQIPDCAELCGGINPAVNDAGDDPDGDGLTNLEEYQAKTLFLHGDSDGDTLTDKQELDRGSNPLVADSDHDGLDDGQEVILGSDPMAADSDGDGMLDGFEVEIGLDPLADDGALDSDGDGFSNLVETYYGSDPQKPGSIPQLQPPGLVRWSYATGSTSQGQAIKAPLIAPGGRIIGFGSLFGLDWQGNELWKTSTDYGSGTITAGGALVIGSGKSITAIDPASGETLWVYSAGDVYHAVLALGPDDTLYIRSSEEGGHHVRALNANTGKEKWTAGGFTAVYGPATVGPDGKIYVVDAIDSLHDVVAALSPVNGSRLWTFDPKAEVYTPMALGIDGSIYLRGRYKSLYALNTDGTRKWAFEAPDNLQATPVVGTDGTIFLGGSNAIHAVGPDGKMRWSQDIRTGGMMSGQVRAMAVARDGVVYYTVSGQRDRFSKVRRGWVRAVLPKTGEQLWSKELTAQAHYFSVGQDGSLIVASFNCHVQNNNSCSYEAKTVAISGQPGGLAPSSWPAGSYDGRQSHYLPACDARDTDGDSIPDCIEERAGLDPHKRADGDADPDGDGLTNAEEYYHKTHFHNADSDGDGLSDKQEITLGLDAKSSDSDGDGMSDGFEVEHALDPKIDDTANDPDLDGFDNKAEHDGGSSPRDKWSVPLGQVVWSFDPGNPSGVYPVLGTDGYLYFSASNRVYRFIPKIPYPEPELFYTADGSVASLMFGNNTLHVTTLDTLTAVNANGTSRWVFPAIGKFSGWPRRPAMATDGTVYLPLQYRGTTRSVLHAIKSDGTPRWAAEAPKNSTNFGDPSVGADGTIYLGLVDGNRGQLFAINPADGSTKWSPTLNTGVYNAPAIAPNGNIMLAANTCHYVLRVTPTGISSRDDPFSGICSWLAAPIIAKDGFMYTVAGSRSRYLYRVETTNGYATEERSVVHWWDAIPGVASADGTLFFVSSSDEVVAVDINEIPRTLWKSPDLGGGVGAPVMTRDGTLFIQGDKLYAIPTKAKGLDQKWPMLGRDPGRTGNIATPVPEQNAKPLVTITQPSGPISVATGSRVRLAATASDAEDGDLRAAISWRSSLTGALGTGPSLTITLSPGIHEVSAAVTDGGGASHEAKVLVDVRPKVPVVTRVTLTGGGTSHWVMAGAVLDFTATAEGGSGDTQYRFYGKQGDGESPLGGWSSTNTLRWDTSGYSGWSGVRVYARSVGQVDPPAQHARHVLVYPAGSASAVTLSTDRSSPQPSGTTLVLTAAASGGGSNFEYLFEHYVADGTQQWVPLRGWSGDASFVWDTSGWTGTRHVRVKARGVGVSQPPAVAYRVFQLDLVGAATAVALTASPAQYAIANGATVTFTALASGGSGQYEYKFELKGQTRNVVQDWSDSASWSWLANTAGAYELAVYARAKGVVQKSVYAVSYHGVMKP